MRIPLFLLACCGLLAAASAARADTPGWYLGGAGGWSQPGDIDSKDSALSFQSKEHHGFGVLGYGGYDFGGVLRTEGEIGYRHADVQSLAVANDGGLGARLGTGSLSGVSSAPTGSVKAISFMMNGIVNLLPRRRLTPYLGVGVGAARLSLDHLGVAGTTIVDDSDIEFAYQGIAGISYAVNRRTSLAIDYRYFRTLDPTFKDASGVPFHTQYHTQNAFLSVTYHFGAPPAPPRPPVPAPVAAPAPMVAPSAAPAPPPAAAPPPLFLVFFDFDRAVLTPAGAKIVEQAAGAFKTSGAARIDVTGYTDRAGGPLYNLKLSKRRADTVRAYLVKLGVPGAAIAEQWRGEADLRVPTADGVREPQNRRVEIMLP